MIARGPLIVFAAVVFLAGGLFALRFPVFIEAYDQFGWQVKCGSGFTTDLTQASNAEKKPPGQKASAAAPHAAGHNYVGQCNNALMARRVWAIPAAALGGLTLTWVAGAALAHDRRARIEHSEG
ncbi:hypothetical protein A5690_09525 [Mycobacterium intracellulare]|uniref:hypothetical protein n=1 Tax=Mycobacterium intracellulare TaxID=1767 RepID=UPI0007EC02F2|nr:hypothetical protein [Mycobacterium intracellulare]OBH35554.1 hypothetical protein A5690_09525 [Mycobacterium intracellulare]